MWTLVFDTTTNFCSIALSQDQSICSCFCEEMAFGQSEVLISKIKEMLDNKHLAVSDLDLIGVCNGPGSFTGVRSSIAAAKAFKIGAPNVTCLGINAFDIYANSLDLKQRSPYNIVIIETKREDFYVAYYDQNLNKTESGKTAFFDEIVSDLQNKKLTLIGDGVERFLKCANGLDVAHVISRSSPPLKSFSNLAATQFKNHQAEYPMPFYLKPANICIK